MDSDCTPQMFFYHVVLIDHAARCHFHRRVSHDDFHEAQAPRPCRAPVRKRKQPTNLSVSRPHSMATNRAQTDAFVSRFVLAVASECS
jgi:hypothetical protein